MIRHLIRRCVSSNAPSLHPTAPIAQLTKHDVGRTVRIEGWVKSRRAMKNTVFVDINDGTGPQNLQVLSTKDPSHRDSLGYGASVCAEGVLGEAPSGQLELRADVLNVIGACPLREGYPFVSKQQHPPDYVREHLHLRSRVEPMAATLRIRDEASFAFASHLRRMRFRQVHTPVMTTNDCEGGGETFTARPDSDELLASMRRSKVPLEQAYFDRRVFLSVSGQLHLEAMCHGLGDVYSFGPIFRAENSKTPIHLTEFYMLEAEQAFVRSITDVTETIETLLKSVTAEVLDEAAADLAVVARTAKSPADFGWLEKRIPVVTYAEAVAVLSARGMHSSDGADGGGLSKEQELFLVQHCGGPVFVVEWPQRMKPFYMRPLPGDERLVEAVDLLVPFVGELCGGSVREDDFARLSAKLPAGGGLDWYLDLRKFGGVTTGGFGIGFERYLQWILGMPNIRDVIPFPRWAHNCAM